MSSATTVIMVTHSSQAVAASRVHAATTSTRQPLAIVTGLQEVVSPAFIIPLASVANVVNRVTMAMRLSGTVLASNITIPYGIHLYSSLNDRAVSNNFQSHNTIFFLPRMIHYDEGLKLETSVFGSLYGG